MKTLAALLLAALVLPAAAGQRVTTSYCLGPCARCGTRGITATGSRAAVGIAVSRRERWRLGQRWWIQGRGKLRVDDVGGGVRPGTFDLRGGSHARNRRWGRRVVNVRRVR